MTGYNFHISTNLSFPKETTTILIWSLCDPVSNSNSELLTQTVIQTLVPPISNILETYGFALGRENPMQKDSGWIFIVTDGVLCGLYLTLLF